MKSKHLDIYREKDFLEEKVLDELTEKHNKNKKKKVKKLKLYLLDGFNNKL